MRLKHEILPFGIEIKSGWHIEPYVVMGVEPYGTAIPVWWRKGRRYPEWRSLALDFPDRFFIGSDTWVNQRWAYYEELMTGYRLWLGGLPADVASKIGWRNGASLFGLN